MDGFSLRWISTYDELLGIALACTYTTGFQLHRYTLVLVGNHGKESAAIALVILDWIAYVGRVYRDGLASDTGHSTHLRSFALYSALQVCGGILFSRSLR